MKKLVAICFLLICLLMFCGCTHTVHKTYDPQGNITSETIHDTAFAKESVGKLDYTKDTDKVRVMLGDWKIDPMAAALKIYGIGFEAGKVNAQVVP